MKSSKRPCRFHQQGRCTYGSRCKFSHAQPQRNALSSERMVQSFDTEAQLEYGRWKRLIQRLPQRDPQSIKELWALALKILDESDKSFRQKLPQDLLDEEHTRGFDHISHLLALTSSSCSPMRLDEVVEPFFKVITHPELLHCISIDSYVGDIYNWFCGSGGQRAIPFVGSILTSVTGLDLESKTDLLVACATSLQEVLKRNPRALYNDELPQILLQLSNLNHESGLEGSNAHAMVSGSVAQAQRLLNRSISLLRNRNAEIEMPKSQPVSTYPRQVRFPGAGRHDNDHADIVRIRLLPTEQEIRCDQADYLPGASLEELSLLDGVERLLDRNFRLYRHDILGELKICLSTLIEACEGDPELMKTIAVPSDGVRAFTYHHVQIGNSWFDKKSGLDFTLTFLQPSSIRKKSAELRQRWWRDNKRLEEGSLLCLLMIVDGRCCPIFLTATQKNTALGDCHGLVAGSMAEIKVNELSFHSARNQEDQLHRLLTSSVRSKSSIGHLLVEFPTVIPATFIPILANLQEMQKTCQLPFNEWLAPTSVPADDPMPSQILPPLYARSPGFRFDLSPLAQRADDTLIFQPGRSNNAETVDKLLTHSSLDKGQCEALLAALGSELALVQGPPGTGKSYLGVQLMRCLLRIKAQAKLGPIIVVCYTNHALDQFLEHLLEVGINKLLRIGGQSKSAALEGKNLRVVSKSEGKTGHEKYLIATSYRSSEELTNSIQSNLKLLHKLGGDWKPLQNFLHTRYPKISSQFSRVDEEGFELAGKSDPFDLWRQGRDGRSQPPQEAGGNLENIIHRANRDVYSVSRQDRQTLIAHWISEYGEILEEKVYGAKQQFDQSVRTRERVHDEADRRILATADVIGVTTTGLAKRISVLRNVQSKVVICEEAAEVIEAHMLSALIPSVEHCIQIGDHQQLRPSVTNYGLSIESAPGQTFQLDRSQFERLTIGGSRRPPLPVAQLNVQRRMRPEISQLIRTTQYPRLEDHHSVQALPDVVGMRHNIHWLDHQNFETGSNADAVQRSKSNDWEVEIVHALVRHLVRQGIYKSTDLALLTPYTGQLQKLRRRMASDFEIVLSDRDQDQLVKDGFVTSSMTEEPSVLLGKVSSPGLEKTALNNLLRIATVDNFQGEEAKIAVVSLVRSNGEKKVGFLRTENRINVLLSRAQHGMYLVGNSETYSNVPMWAKVLGMLRLNNSVGQSFALCCPRHPDTPIECSQAEDFTSLSPEGGCRLTCDKRLDACGHKCQAKCHSDMLHRVWPCPEPCPRLRDICNHSCPKTCSETCGPCRTIVDHVLLPCGHYSYNVECYRTRDTSSIKCFVRVTKIVPTCEHSINTACNTEVSSTDFVCPEKCGTILPCSHSCLGKCGNCRVVKASPETPDEHVTCRIICGRPFSTCTHTCPQACHSGTDCGNCKSPCEVQCKHSKCNKACHEACSPCIQTCAWECEHQGKCTMPCAAPCNRLPCDTRCAQPLACGHQCPGLCGEECPSVEYCQLCCNEDKKAHRVDMLEFRTFAEIDPKETPIVVLKCGHFFTAETLDGHMQMAEVYDMDVEGKFTALKDDGSGLSEHPPRCPDCKRTITQFSTQRYNRSINRSVLDESSKRFIVSGTARIHDLDQRLDQKERELEEVRDEYSRSPQDQRTPSNARALVRCIQRESEAQKLIRDISRFSDSVSDSCQPARKLHDATALAIARSQDLLEQMSALSMEIGPAAPRDNRVVLGSRRLIVKAMHMVLSHGAQLAKHTELKLRSGFKIEEFTAAAQALIKESREAHLPRILVETVMYYASTIFHFRRAKEQDLDMDDVLGLLNDAEEACRKSSFQNAEEFLVSLGELKKALRGNWYEAVTKDELASIKLAMLSGHQGIATHSGHWYNCENGHPFAVGECGMPMHEARCPECGAVVGGQHHQPAAGVTRARDME